MPFSKQKESQKINLTNLINLIIMTNILKVIQLINIIHPTIINFTLSENDLSLTYQYYRYYQVNEDQIIKNLQFHQYCQILYQNQIHQILSKMPKTLIITTIIYQLVIISFITISTVQTYNYIPSYTAYTKQWLSIVPSHSVHNLTHLIKNDQKCESDKKCQYILYEYSAQKQKTQNGENHNEITVLFVGGMHGNEQVGPISLLNLYPYLQRINPYRVLIFPVANPSGYCKSSRLTYPSQIDPNRDFPIDGQDTCYQTASTLIIDYIYRTWKIDISISIHNGGEQIAWPWGSNAHMYQNHFTVEQSIYQDIGRALKYVGGSNSVMSQFSIGTMNDVVYPAQGTYQDWAYAGSWEPNGKKCTPKDYQLKEYPKTMTNSLVFLLELSPHSVDSWKLGGPQSIPQKLKQEQLGVMKAKYYSNDNIKENGYVSRAIRMFMLLVKIANPRLNLLVKNNKVLLDLQGCKSGTLTMKITGKQGDIYKTQNKKINGNLMQQVGYQPHSIQIKSQCNVNYEYMIICDQEWFGKGNTVFGKNKRTLSGKGILYLELLSSNLTTNVGVDGSDTTFIFILGLLIGASCTFTILFGYYIYNKKSINPNKKQAQQQLESQPLSGKDLL